MKWLLIVPIALIASFVMFGCSADEEDSSYQQPAEGETSVEGEVAEGGRETTVGTETQEPL